jgi:hypothetical protein
MSELWGFQSGQSQRQADDQSKGLFELRMAEGSIDLKTKQLTYDNAKLMQTRQEAAIKMMQSAQGKPGATGSSADNPVEGITNTLFSLANIDIQSGLPEQGLDAIKSASSLQANHAKITHDTTMDQIRRFGFLSNSLTEVNDQTSWDQAKMIFQSNFPGQLDPRIANMPYSPQLIKQLSAGTQTALSKANESLSKARADEVKTNEKLQAARIPLASAQTRLDNDRADAIEKNGGANSLPKPAQVSSVKDLITSKYPDITKGDLDTNALHVAREAKRLIDDQGVDPETAYRRAFLKADEGGRFAGLRPGRTRGGTSTSNALIGAKKDISKMDSPPVNNMIYDGKDLGHPGEFYFWDSSRKGWTKITEGDTSEDEPEEDNSDEDK